MGYCITSTRRRLKAELQGASRHRIKAARAAGEDIHDIEEIRELAFCGDTNVTVVDKEPPVTTARRLILEVTFLDDRVSVERARRTGHVHFDEFLERADRFENEAILLTHASRRYSNETLEGALERLPERLRGKVSILRREAPWD